MKTAPTLTRAGAVAAWSGERLGLLLGEHHARVLAYRERYGVA